MPKLAPAVVLAALAVIVAAPLHAQTFDAEQHFKGKTIRFIVSWASGGTGDSYVRLLVRHFSRHIPSNPSFVVENMPGGGHNIATNYMYAQAEPTSPIPRPLLR